MFVGFSPVVTNWSADNSEFSLVFEENPLAEFVELPEDPSQSASSELWYSNIYPGVIRGALEMVQIQVQAYFVSDALRGDETTELRVKLIKYLDEEVPPSDD